MNLIAQAEQFVFNLFKDKLSTAFIYHNFEHTQTVVKAVIELGQAQQISEADLEQLILAAWFHDTGYIVKGCNEHEAESILIATDFLQQQQKGAIYITTVVNYIKATKFDHIPQNDLEKIIKDADFKHFANENYMYVAEWLRKELEMTCQKVYSDLEWLKENLRMFQKMHHYYTPYAVMHWQPMKEKNSKRLEKRIQKMENTAAAIPENKKNKEERPERGIDTMFRVTLNNHTRLSEIADSKANILLSVNTIIISIALSILIPKLDNPKNAHLIMPTFVMLLFSVITIIFAILSTRPKVTSGVFTPKDVEERKVNLLFFGNFYKMPYSDYEWAINEVMKDREYLYNSMIRDLYYLGLVLERKYRLLRLTYNIFMFGIIISVITFVIAFKTSGT